MCWEYSRMEKAIRYIEENALTQPELEKLAGHIGLSPFHFQRQFRKWTGLSPKRYLQFLTVERAKDLLLQSSPVLDTAFNVGLSGPGRLHDLFLSVEAMTPGQFKTFGEGMVIRYQFSESPFGRCLVALTDRGISDLRFVDKADEKDEESKLREKWTAARLVKDRQSVDRVTNSIFKTAPDHGGVGEKLDLQGTNFQIKVWQALLQIPEGTVVSYSDLARRIGRPRAIRAVAGAVGSNPVAWLIPCHRVLRKSGQMGGYRWGITRKKIMLARELAAGYSTGMERMEDR